jgi:uncharacterized protein
MKASVNRSVLVGIISIGMAIGSSACLAASFDCTKARSPVEKAICSDAALSQLDDELGATFRKAVAENPQVRQQQTTWLRNTRDKCETVDCLVTVYRAQIQDLGGATAQAPNAPPPASAVTAESNPLALFLDAKAFIGNSALLQEYSWSNPKQPVFGKQPAEWTDQDFQLLEDKLRAQILSERRDAAERLQRVPGLKRTPDEDSIYLVSKRALDNAISLIPKFKYWAGQAREKVRIEEAAQQERAERQEAQQQALAAQQARDAARRQDQLLEQERQRQANEVQRQKDDALRQAEAQKKASSESMVMNLEILAVVLFLVGAGWYWNRFVRNRCPNCKSSSFDRVSETEIDRWRGTRQVTEKHSRGTNTRHVQDTFVKRRLDYRCSHCQQEWSKERQESVGGSSNFDRFIAGY